MKNLTGFCFVFLYMISTSCIVKTNKTYKEGLIPISLTDTCAKELLTEYIKAYPFDGKGVYLLNIMNYHDSIKYYIGVAFNQPQTSAFLKSAPYYFYDIINQRIVIVDTKLEKFIKPQNLMFESDTILQKYYDNKVKFREIYFMEYKKVSDSLSRKVIYFDPF